MKETEASNVGISQDDQITRLQFQVKNLSAECDAFKKSYLELYDKFQTLKKSIFKQPEGECMPQMLTDLKTEMIRRSK